MLVVLEIFPFQLLGKFQLDNEMFEAMWTNTLNSVDADGCASIVYVQAGCNGMFEKSPPSRSLLWLYSSKTLGCFDPLCTNGVSRVEFTSTALGGVVTVDGSTDFSSGGISDGDLICSTGQVG